MRRTVCGRPAKCLAPIGRDLTSRRLCHCVRSYSMYIMCAGKHGGHPISYPSGALNTHVFLPTLTLLQTCTLTKGHVGMICLI